MATGRIRNRGTDVRDAALTLFAERGYHGTSMKDIAAAVGMRAPSLYNHVGAKQELLVEIVEATLVDLQRRHEAAVGSTSDVAQALRRAVEAHVRYHARHPREVRVGNRDLSALEPANRERLIGLRRRYARSWQALLQRGADEGRFDLPDPRLASYALLEMGIGVATWFRPDGPLSEDVVAYHYGDMALRLAGAVPSLSPAAAGR
jgi:AcrR family transcriptional regulator